MVNLDEAGNPAPPEATPQASPMSQLSHEKWWRSRLWTSFAGIWVTHGAAGGAGLFCGSVAVMSSWDSGDMGYALSVTGVPREVVAQPPADLPCRS